MCIQTHYGCKTETGIDFSLFSSVFFFLIQGGQKQLYMYINMSLLTTRSVLVLPLNASLH